MQVDLRCKTGSVFNMRVYGHYCEDVQKTCAPLYSAWNVDLMYCQMCGL
jgi:hypothetical protein